MDLPPDLMGFDGGPPGYADGGRGDMNEHSFILAHSIENGKG
jgi:hypothetical protein